jgi:hypothetical protein
MAIRQTFEYSVVKVRLLNIILTLNRRFGLNAVSRATCPQPMHEDLAIRADPTEPPLWKYLPKCNSPGPQTSLLLISLNVQ